MTHSAKLQAQLRVIALASDQNDCDTFARIRYNLALFHITKEHLNGN